MCVVNEQLDVMSDDLHLALLDAINTHAWVTDPPIHLYLTEPAAILQRSDATAWVAFKDFMEWQTTLL